jgi:transketolase
MDMEPFAAKFRAFGWEARDVDGHDPTALHEALTEPKAAGAPFALIAATKKGKGVAFMENKAEWHHGRLTEALYAEATRREGR